MTSLDEFTDGEIFNEYERRVHDVARDIANELNGRNKHDSLEGRRWCEESDVPENAFADAVNWYLSGVNWGVSPMYPFRNEDMVLVDEFEEEGDDEEEEVESLDETQLEETPYEDDG